MVVFTLVSIYLFLDIYNLYLSVVVFYLWGGGGGGANRSLT